MNPGLIYDFHSHEIIHFLCSTGATPGQPKNLTEEIIHCQNRLPPSYNFNYPSIGVSNMNGSLSIHRTVTYYGERPTVYVVHIKNPTSVKVSVSPAELYKDWGEDVLRVDFIPFKKSDGSFVFGDLTWSNGIHRARSPIGLNVLSL